VRARSLIPVILAIWEAEIWRITVGGQQAKLSQDPLLNRKEA
jgi:hypothetical protein